MFHRTVLRAAVALLATQVPAQLPRDSWAVTAFTTNSFPGGLWVVAPGQTAITQPQPQSQAMAWANAVAADETGSCWYGTVATATVQPNEVFWVLTSSTQVVLEQRLTNGPVGTVGQGQGISGLVKLGNRIWYCTLEGLVGWVNAFTPTQAPNTVLTMALGANQYLNAIATDGRDVFVAVFGSASGPSVFAIDPTAASPVSRPVAAVRGAGTSQPSCMALGPDGNLLIGDFDTSVRRVDTVTGNFTTANQAGLYPINGGSCNPWLHLWCAMPGSGTAPRPIDFLDLATGQWLPNTLAIAAGCAPSGAAPVCEQPCLLFGSGCPGLNNVEPRLRWTGLPRAGGTAAITVQPTASSGLVLFLLGGSRTQSALGPLPLGGASFGAPGCRLLVSADVVLAQATTGGIASQPLALPANPGLAGLTAYAQWGVFAPVNALGFVTSEAVEIRVR